MTTNRLERRSLSKARLYALLVVGCLFLAAATAVITESVGAVVGAVGVYVGIVALLLQEFASQTSGKRKLAFVATSSSTFSVSIRNGLEEGLKERLICEFVEPGPIAGVPFGSVPYQIEILRRSDVRACHAVVIRPAAEDERLARELAELTIRGAFVVTVDTRIPLDPFYELGAQLPHFVGSDFKQGGQHVGAEIIRQATLRPTDGIIVLEGPHKPTPNGIRVAWALHALLNADLDIPIVVECLERFDERCAVDALVRACGRLDRRCATRPTQIVLHSGTDKLAIAIGALVDECAVPELERREVRIIGYDGARDLEGNLLVRHSRHVVATVDQLPSFQGREAANVVVSAYRGAGAGLPRKAIIEPQLLTRPNWM